MTSASFKDRFWANVAGGEPEDCWPWLRAQRKGYGSVKAALGDLGLDRRRNLYAHRVVYYLTHGVWPEPLARHTCDNPICCNPAHIVDGTWGQNMQDKMVRGRHVVVPGTRNHNSSLTEQDVAQIRELAGTVLTQREIAARFGIAQPTVSRIVRKVRYW